jgi:uncharacterized protein with ParB-like and HNH nuclease domain
MADNIILKSINELLGMKFFIPSYQRGYRWTEQQVRDLLNDVNEFDPLKDGNFYCLQPLVVHKNIEENDEEILNKIKVARSLDDVRSFISDKWNVVDGQQRLTTIYLILNIINTNTFDLEFERENLIKKINTITVDLSFVDIKDNELVKDINSKWEELCKKGAVTDKPDMYYLFLAKSYISWWWNKRDSNQQDIFKNKILHNIKFLWYDIGDNENEHKLFENLNSGKIPLTNAELIKALFINNVEGVGFARELQQSIIADEFDQMERALRKDEMWYFLAGNKEKPSSCLDLVFNLMLDASKESNNYRDKDYRSFFYIKNHITNIDWNQVKTTFFILQGWYEDSVLYNLIGYLRAVGVKLKSIFSWWDADENEDKKSFEIKLRNECFNRIGEDYLDCKFDKNKKKVRNVLLLFNIATLVGKPEEKARFSFESYHKNNWDVEHISPQNPNLENRELLVLLTEPIPLPNEESNDTTKKQSLVDMYPILKELVDALKTGYEEGIKTELKKYFAIEGEDVMSLKNLTLLSAHDNRGIGNNFFFVKRDKLKQYYQQGSYIPIGSLNVFSKFYSTYPKEPLFWSEEDAGDYLNVIEKTINFFKTGTE